MLVFITLILIAVAIYILKEGLYEGVYWGWLGLALFIGGVALEYFYRSFFGTMLGFCGILLIFASYYFVVKAKKAKERAIKQKYRPQKTDRYKVMPTDAHAQVEALARIIYSVYKYLPSAKNDFAKGSLYIYKKNGVNTINFWYDWDFSPAESIVREHYDLDPVIVFENGDTIRYTTNKIDDFGWIVHPMTKNYYFDPVVATLKNECPGLQITNRKVFSDGICVEFQYR